MVTVKRSIFPLGKVNVRVNDKDFSLGSNGVKVLEDVSNETECTVEARIKWMTTDEKISLRKNSRIRIVSSISDLHYIFWGTISFILCVLLFFSLVPPIYLGIVLLIFYAPIVYYTLFKKSQYFKIYLE
ncbi:hypothetical protein AB9J70_06025 [Elizabethkingia anophelis]|uniref:hypothetical protein n=1 Tax=Elizabethkingia anophelis TaxID=1117645 RepID=UPI00355854DC